MPADILMPPESTIQRTEATAPRPSSRAARRLHQDRHHSKTSRVEFEASGGRGGTFLRGTPEEIAALSSQFPGDSGKRRQLRDDIVGLNAPGVPTGISLRDLPGRPSDYTPHGTFLKPNEEVPATIGVQKQPTRLYRLLAPKL